MKPTKKGIQTAPLMDSPYKSTTPYGLTEPLDSCQDPTKCTEVVDTDCVIYTGPNISCQDTTVINTDDTLTEALQGVVDYFCANGGGGGNTGPQGVQGKTGSQGSTGQTGTPGIQGATGTGSQGAQGVQGKTGAQGLRGVQGYTGDPGLNGTQGVQGVQGLQGVQGKLGTQGSVGSGAQGVQGRTGTQGADGTNGTNGAQGATGAGIQGAQGSQGVQGFIGSQGVQGADGVGSSYAKQHAFEAGSPNSFDYQGNAPVGTLQSATGWTIYRVVVNAAGSSYIQSAVPNPNCIWDNYNTYSYL